MFFKILIEEKKFILVIGLNLAAPIIIIKLKLPPKITFDYVYLPEKSTDFYDIGFI